MNADELARRFHEDGFCLIEDVFPVDTIDAAHDAAVKNFRECMSLIEEQGLSFGVGVKQGFKEIVQRHPRRFEMPFRMDAAVFDFPLRHEGLQRVVRAILRTEEPSVANRSCVLSLPDTEAQAWHTDGPHASFTEYLPCHVLNVFVPLLDVADEQGPTQFRPGSQRFTNDLARGLLLAKIKKQLRPIEIPPLKKGSVLLFDYRVLHRGGANTSDSERPILVFTFSQPWYKDNLNFPARSLFSSQAQDSTPPSDAAEEEREEGK